MERLVLGAIATSYVMAIWIYALTGWLCPGILDKG
jgi:hypothetical protein